MTTLRNFEYLIAVGTKVDLYFTTTGEVVETSAPNYGNNMDREVISIYPIDKGYMRISLGKEVTRGK